MRNIIIKSVGCLHLVYVVPGLLKLLNINGFSAAFVHQLLYFSIMETLQCRAHIKNSFVGCAVTVVGLL